MLDNLIEKQLLLEISNLRITVWPNIRQHRRVKLASGWFKQEYFSIPELKVALQNAVKPVIDIKNDINQLLKSVLEQKYTI